MKKLILILLTLLLSQSLMAADERWINFDWEIIPDASGYEVELFQEVKSEMLERGIYKTDIAEWSHPVSPGKYFARIRAIDKRGVSGEWTEKFPISIKSAPPKLDHPFYEETFEVANDDGYLQKFSWTPTTPSPFYKFLLFNHEHKLIHSEITTQTELTFLITQANQYYWSVAALNSKDDEIETGLKQSPFKISYGKLTPTDFSVNVSKENLIVHWNNVPHSQSYIINFYFQLHDGTFKKIFEDKTSETLLTYKKDLLEKGTYRLSAVAVGTGYTNSDEAELVYEYDHEEIKVLIEKSSDDGPKDKRNKLKSTLEAFLALPSLTYTFKNYEKDTIGNQSLSGTSVEINSIIPLIEKEKKNFLTINNSLRLMSLADTYSSSLFAKLETTAQVNYNYRNLLLSPQAGVFVEKTPAFIISRLNTASVDIQDFVIIGPMIGLKESYNLNEHWNLFSNQNLYYNLTALKILSGNKLSPAASLEINFGSKYFFKPNLDLVGKITLKNTTINSSASTQGSSYASSSDINSITMSGTIFSGGVDWYY